MTCHYRQAFMHRCGEIDKKPCIAIICTTTTLYVAISSFHSLEREIGKDGVCCLGHKCLRWSTCMDLVPLLWLKLLESIG